MRTAIIKARDFTQAQHLLREKFPFSKIFAYKFVEDFKYVEKKKRNYKDRKMKIVFVRDYEKFKKKWLK